MRKTAWRTVGGVLGALTWVSSLGACQQGSEDLVSRGERVYRANCAVCHNLDPTREGTLGPPVAGSSRELVEARVLRGEYPPGYTPKRDTLAMPPLPVLKGEIDAITAFLGKEPEGS